MKTKKHGVICLILAFSIPVASTLILWAATCIQEACAEGFINFLAEHILPVINLKVSLKTFMWLDECVLFFMGVTACAFPALLYSAIVRFVTPKAESVYLTPRLSLWVNCASAACGVTVASAVLLVSEILSETDVSRYPNRIRALSVFLPIVFVAFTALALVYIFSWHRKKDSEGNSLPIRVIFLDILRGILALPGYALMACIGYNLLLILFSDAF